MGLPCSYGLGWFRCYRLPLRFEETGRGLRPIPRVPAAAPAHRRWSLLRPRPERERGSTARRYTLRRSCGERAGPAGGCQGRPSIRRPAEGSRVPCRRARRAGSSRGRAWTRDRRRGPRKSASGAIFKPLTAQCADPYGTQQAPLVLAGVEYVRAMYRDVNTYPHLLEAGICGSPGSDVNRRAPYTRMGVGGARTSRATGTLQRPPTQEALCTGRASASLEDVLTAAEAGRIDVLFVPTGAHVLSASHASAGVSQADGGQEFGGGDQIEQAVGWHDTQGRDRLRRPRRRDAGRRSRHSSVIKRAPLRYQRREL